MIPTPMSIIKNAWTAEGAGSAKADIIQKHNQDVRRSFWRAQRLDGRVSGIRVAAMLGCLPTMGTAQLNSLGSNDADPVEKG
jgi:hypothetical protein